MAAVPQITVRARNSHKLFTIIGAMVIFITFVVKDAWRERLKEQADAIKAEEVIDSVKSNFDDLMTMEQAIGSGLMVPEGKIRGKDAAAFESIILSSMTLRLLRNQQRANRLLKIAPDKILEERLKICKETIQEAIKFNANMQESLPKLRPDQQKDFERKYQSAFSTFGDVQVLLNELVLALDNNLSLQQENAEKRYALVTNVSYGLYVLGWVLALFGRLRLRDDDSIAAAETEA